MNIELLDTKFPAKGSGEARGEHKVHATELIKRVGVGIGAMKDYAASGGGWDKEPLSMAAEMGFIWEDVLSEAWATRVIGERPGELEHDGILLSPDGVRWDDSTLTEFKVTWKSKRKVLRDWDLGGPAAWYYQRQAMLYLKALSLNVVEHFFLFVNGDYSPMQPAFQHIRTTFDDWELEESWEMVKSAIE